MIALAQSMPSNAEKADTKFMMTVTLISFQKKEGRGGQPRPRYPTIRDVLSREDLRTRTDRPCL